MKKITFWKALRFLPCLLFLGIMTSLFLRNGATFLQYTKDTLPDDYKQYTQGIEKHLSENLAGKYDYIDLNGSAFRLLGLNTLNECFRLDNGYLASFSDFTDIDASADDVKALSDFLDQQEIPFLYTYIPAKEHSFDATVSAEYASHVQNDKVKELARALDARQVNHLDLDGWFQENGWKMEDIYFRTDHHWLPEAAFATARVIMERFAETADIVFQEETLDPENWTFEVHEDVFLGSQGKKTGQAYAGVDDLCLITPNYPVETYIGRVHPDRSISAYDSTTVYWPGGLEGENIYWRDPYGVYLGNSYPYLYLRNDLAVNQKKILIIGDSYRLPTECFLTTQFSEIFHVDMRDNPDGSFATLLNQIQPDLVLYICVLPVYDDVQNFGLEEWETSFGGKTLEAPCMEISQLSFEGKEETAAFSPVVDSLAAGSYQLTLGDAALGDGLELIQFALMDKATEEVVTARYFLTEYGESQTWLFTVPEDGDYQIVAYHGMPGNTEGKPLTLEEIVLQPFA